MIGLGIAAIVAVLGLVFGATPAVAFKRSTKFLYCWYLTVAVVLALVLGFVAVTGSAATGLLFGGVIGGILGTAIGSTAAIVITLVIVLAYVFQIFGARLLYNSVVVNQDGSHAFNQTQLGVGIALLVVGLFIMPLLS